MGWKKDAKHTASVELDSTFNVASQECGNLLKQGDIQDEVAAIRIPLESGK